MTPDIIWSSIGIAVSVIFGVLGIYLTLKSRYPGRITFVNEQMIELFDAVGNSLDKLAVTYDGNNINQNLVLLNGAFINSGKTDIEPGMVEKPITLKLPEGYKWLTAKLVKSATNATLNILDEKHISISTGLFRCGEYVRFHALAQVPDDDKSDKSISKRLRAALKFEHRITNTKNINETDVKNKASSKKELKRRGLPYLIMFVVTILLAVYSIYEGVPKSLVFPYTTDGKTNEYVRIETNAHDSNVEINSIESNFNKKLPFDDFLLGVKGVPRLEKEETKKTMFLLIMIGIQVFAVSAILGMQVYEYLRNRRILKILGEI